ncbi:MAG: restriction endonuclease subunit S, partial [Prevotella sp.]|nr:restriction endonuclease subunit S [Prevotella sp.]
RANIPKINREALMAYQTMLPPICLQKSFASQMKVIEETKSNISSQIAEMQTLYKSRMQYWFD